MDWIEAAAIGTAIVAFLGWNTDRKRIQILKKQLKLNKTNSVFEINETKIFPKRDLMTSYFSTMFEKASPDDEIWTQCVGCSSYSPDAINALNKANSRGVNFRVILNKNTRNIQISKILTNLGNVKVRYNVNNIRFQGLSEKELLLVFKNPIGHTSILINDINFIKFFKTWFDKKFEVSEQYLS